MNCQVAAINDFVERLLLKVCRSAQGRAQPVVADESGYLPALATEQPVSATLPPESGSSAKVGNGRCPAVPIQRRLASSDDNARLSGGRRYATVTPCLPRRRLRLPVMAMASTAEHPVA